MRVRFPLGRPVESGARDLSLAESCALGLRSQMPGSSVAFNMLDRAVVTVCQTAAPHTGSGASKPYQPVGAKNPDLRISSVRTVTNLGN